MAYIRPKQFPDTSPPLPLKPPVAKPRTMSNGRNGQDDKTIDTRKWNALVVRPVMKALEERFANTGDIEDASHVTIFILKVVEQEMPKIMQHVACAQKLDDFASMIILASAAPESVYSTLCNGIQSFIRCTAKAKNIDAIDRYFDFLREDSGNGHGNHPGSRLSLMFIRDAAYISSPSNIRQLIDLGIHDEALEMEDHLKRLTLAMCEEALGTPGISDTKDLQKLVPFLARSVTLSGDHGFISLGDSISEVPATKHSISERKDQLLNFLHNFHSKI